MSATKLLASVGLVMVGLAAQQAQAVLVITPSAGYTISWNGNDGANFSVSNPAPPPNNPALASNGSTPFASSQFGANHLTVKLNDGSYGNTDSWIANGADVAFPAAGVAFPGSLNITSVAWGRDNGNTAGDCCGGQLPDRDLGLYTLQRTTVVAPGAGTPVTGVAATGWETIGTFAYNGETDIVVGGGFTAHFRHEYQITLGGAAVPSTGLRITAPNGTAIDEIEAYVGSAFAGLSLVSVTQPGVVPNNLALSANGSIAVAKDLRNGAGFGVHAINELNDGVYGNSNSWIGNSDPTFGGIALGTPQVIGSIAWGRDSDGTVSFFDRAAGIYVVEFTTAANPNAATPDNLWQALGSATYATTDANRFLRHLYTFDPVFATGVRIRTMNGEAGIAIDEIEVFAAVVPEPASASLALIGLAGLALRRRSRAA